MNFFLGLLLFYLLYRIVRTLLTFTVRVRSFRKEEYQEPAPKPAKKKLIDSREGEYVDFEDITDKKA